MNRQHTGRMPRNNESRDGREAAASPEALRFDCNQRSWERRMEQILPWGLHKELTLPTPRIRTSGSHTVRASFLSFEATQVVVIACGSPRTLVQEGPKVFSIAFKAASPRAKEPACRDTQVETSASTSQSCLRTGLTEFQSRIVIAP